MPTEHDFSRGRRNPYASRLADEARLVFARPDGSIDEQIAPPRAEAAPDSLTGTVDDALFYVYNGRDDVLSVRLTASLSEPVSTRQDDSDYQLLVSEESGMVVGLVVFGYLRRIDYLAPLLAFRADQDVRRTWVERGMAPLRSLLPAA